MMRIRVFKHIAIGIAVSLVAVLVFGAPTGLIPNPLFGRMIPSTLLDYVFLALTSLLLAAYVALHLYAKSSDRKPATVSAYGGLLGGVMAFGCPLCNKVFVLALGTSSILNYIEPFRPVIGAVSFAVMGVAVYLKAKTSLGATACPVLSQSSSQ